jgi:hypothetical protein
MIDKINGKFCASVKQFTARRADVLRPLDPAEHDRQQQIDIEMRRATLRQIATWNRQRAARR